MSDKLPTVARCTRVEGILTAGFAANLSEKTDKIVRKDGTPVSFFTATVDIAALLDADGVDVNTVAKGVIIQKAKDYFASKGIAGSAEPVAAAQAAPVTPAPAAVVTAQPEEPAAVEAKAEPKAEAKKEKKQNTNIGVYSLLISAGVLAERDTATGYEARRALIEKAIAEYKPLAALN